MLAGVQEQGVTGKEDKPDAEVYPKSPLRPPPPNLARPKGGADAIYVGYGKE